MRPGEFVLLIVALLAVAVLRQSLLRNEKHLLVWACLLPFIAAIAQAAIEGARWQLGPCYVSWMLIALVSLVNWPGIMSADRAQNLLKQFVPFNFCLIAAAVSLTTLVPIVSLPSPSGNYAVGTSTYHLIDQGRSEIFCPDNKRRRELIIQIWYPAIASTGKRAPFMAFSNDFRPFLGTPFFALMASHLHLIGTSAWQSAPMAPDQDRYAVLIFSHGLMGGRIQNTVQEQELASHGYIVVGVDHTYDGAFTVISPDQNIPSALLVNSLAPTGQAGKLLIEQGLSVRVADLRFVLDQLEKLDKSDPQRLLTNRLDLQRVGLFGHSFGGATALVACAADRRFGAGLSMDGDVSGRNMSMSDSSNVASLTQPFLFMQARRASVDALGTDQLCAQLKNQWWTVTIEGAAHGNFTDLPFLTPLHRLSMLTGPIDSLRAMKIINAYSLAFFDRALGGKKQGLLESQSKQYPEVVLRQTAKNTAAH